MVQHPCVSAQVLWAGGDHNTPPHAVPPKALLLALVMSKGTDSELKG